MRSTLALVAIAGLAALTVFATEGGSTGLRRAKADSLITRCKLLYSSYSCRGCHTIDGRGNAGPTFKHLYGSRVKLTTGRTVIANDAYLLRSILDPNAQIVATYRRNVMTMVIKKGTVPRRDALALVAFIKSLK
jgi:cytochrome c oxidase subunit II